MMGDNIDVLNAQELTALSKLAVYRYKINSLEEEPIRIQIEEYYDLSLITEPSYNVLINGYIVKKQVTKYDMPDRFLYVIDLIDHYIDTRIREK